MDVRANLITNNRANSLSYKSQVSFGESEGGTCTNELSKNESKRMQINQKYNNMRKSWFDIADSTKATPEEFWKQLRKIEILKQKELDKLIEKPNKFFFKILNPLRFFK